MYLFDYDKPGINAWSIINDLSKQHNQLEAIFYQQDYTITKDTSNPNINKDLCFLEDLFDNSCYESTLEELKRCTSYHLLKETKGKITDKIKKQIEDNYLTYSEDEFQGFIPLLNKLLEVFPSL